MKNDFLQTIVDYKKKEIQESKRKVSEKKLREKAETTTRKKRPFRDTIAQKKSNTINIIAEIKRASPSKGDICPNLNPHRYASLYEKGGAAALSVLTETKFFKGSFEDFHNARKGCNLPMLRKDFLISSYQIFESAVLQADAVLLIARILSRDQLKEYLMLCSELGLDTLVEIHSEADLKNAAWAKAELIGINNRNLSSFDTDINVAMRLASQLESYQIPVAASGINVRDDIVKNREFGINNFLIGESLVRSENPAAFIQSLIK